MLIQLGNPFESLLNIQKALSDTLDNSFFGDSVSTSGVHPPVNLFEKDNSVVLITEIPGVQKNDIDLKVQKNTVILEVNREQKENNKESLHRQERKFGKYNRSIKIPYNIDASKIKADYSNGILKINLPYAETEKAKSIEIN